LEISLDSPAANLVGFEHQPSTDEQSQQVAKVKAQLENPTSLFDIPAAAECSLTKTELQAALMQVSSDSETAKPEHKHAADKHEHEHKQAGEKHEHEPEEHAHSDIEATWQFTCAKPAELGSLSTKLFAAFPAIKKLNVEWLNGDKASAVSLEQDAAVLLK
jgi:ABC-type Zn2+ transport system substrate-binding protein/surface adhesin